MVGGIFADLNRQWHNMQRAEPDGVTMHKGVTFREWHVNSGGLYNIVRIHGNDVSVYVPPLLDTSFTLLAKHGWWMRVRHRSVNGKLLRAQVRFYEPKTDVGVTVRLQRRQFIDSIWDVVDELEQRQLTMKVFSMPNVEALDEPSKELRPIQQIANDMHTAVVQGKVTFVSGNDRTAYAVPDVKMLDELSMLQIWNEARRQELAKRPRTPKQEPDLTNVVKLDEYLDKIQLNGNKEVDTNLDERIARVMNN